MCAGKGGEAFQHVMIRPREWSKYESALTAALQRIERRIECGKQKCFAAAFM